jgi:ubiquinone/menaquinone biosynthesis C-methylase UbiE
MQTKQLPENSPAAVKPKPPISAWLSELERKNAREFQRRTGLEYQATIAQIVEAADLRPDSRVLDVATGTGMIARHLAAHITSRGKVIGIDETKEQVDRARLEAQSAGLGTKVEWRVVKTRHLPFDPDTFDVVTCCLAFHQLSAPDFVKEACRVLKPEGTLLIAAEVASKAAMGELRLKVRRSYYQFVARKPGEAEAQYHSSGEIADFLREAGFRHSLVRELRRQSVRHARAFMLIKAVK